MHMFKILITHSVFKNDFDMFIYPRQKLHVDNLYHYEQTIEQNCNRVLLYRHALMDNYEKEWVFPPYSLLRKLTTICNPQKSKIIAFII